MLKTLFAALAMLVLACPAYADEAALQALKARIDKGEIEGVHSVIVVRGRDTLAEWYFSGRDEARGRPLGQVTFGPDTLHDVRSVTKSVVGLLVGIAVDEGAIRSLDTSVLDYFPEYPDLDTPERRRVTLRHLLTMTSGLHWDEDTYTYADPRNSEIAMDLAKDPYRYVLSQPFDSAPGERWKYSGGDVAVMAAVLARSTNTPIDVYAQRKLFGPLGMGRTEWIKDRNGVPYAASGLRMTPRDMVRIGRLVLAEGRWEGRRIVSARWIRESITARASVQPDPRCGTRYGYFWWLFQGCQLDPPLPWAAAVGNGVQRIMVVPGQDLVIVMTAGLYNSPKQGPTSAAVLVGALAAVRK